MQRRLFIAIAALVIAAYAALARPGMLEWASGPAGENYYNLLVQGLRTGRLSLAKEVPKGLERLPDPYDPIANAPYRSLSGGLHDLSFFHGRLYLYFGITPALILFWPFAILTGRYLSHCAATVLFCSGGFLAASSLLCSARRRYFPDISRWIVAAGVVAVGLGSGIPPLLARSEVYEVAIACGGMLTMFALEAIWKALHTSHKRRIGWTSAASAAFGLAVGARPSLAPAAFVLLVPLLAPEPGGADSGPDKAARGSRAGALALLTGAAAPLGLCVLGLLLFNHLRFGSMFEFGQHYQLAGDSRQAGQIHFSPRFLAFNLRVYFVDSVGLGRHFPFVRNMLVHGAPPGHGALEQPFGVLADTPFAFLALAAPLAWRRTARSAESVSGLRWFTGAVAYVFAANTVVLGLYYYVASRFEAEVLPCLIILSVLGTLGLERTLARRTAWRRAGRWCWVTLLGVSVAFNLCTAVAHRARASYDYGTGLMQIGRLRSAEAAFEYALRLDPDIPEAHNNLGLTLGRLGRLSAAIEHYKTAIRLEPNLADAQYNLGIALFDIGKRTAAAGAFRAAVRDDPENTDARYDLGSTLLLLGRPDQAKDQFRAILGLRPDFAEAHSNLGSALLELGRIREARCEFEKALRLNPSLSSALNNLRSLNAAEHGN